MLECHLLETRWLYRRFEVVTPEGQFIVEYDGRGMGYESIRVNGIEAVRLPSYLWYVPRFEFMIGTIPAILEVRVWIWMAVKSLTLSMASTLLYDEGGHQESVPLIRP